MPWWAYGPVGMQLLVPLSGAGSNGPALPQQQLWTASSSGRAASSAFPTFQCGSATASSSSSSSCCLAHSGRHQQQIAGDDSDGGGAVQGSGPPAPPASGSHTPHGNSRHPAPEAAAGHYNVHEQQHQQQMSTAAAAAGMKHAQSAPHLLQRQQQPGGWNSFSGLGSSVGGALAEPGTEIELEFDREVYPIGVSIAASIVGVTQRVLRSAAAAGTAVQHFDAVVISLHDVLPPVARVRFGAWPTLWVYVLECADGIPDHEAGMKLL